jgi:zinc transporter ZupT
MFGAPFMGGLLGLKAAGENNNRKLKLFLAFSGAFLLSVTVLSLIPEVYKNDKPEITGLFVLAGFLFQLFIEQFSQGIEHGHLHAEHHHGGKIPYPVFISLSIHSFLEGIPIGGFIHQGTSTFNGLLLGVSLHEIPAAFALVTVLKFADVPTNKIWLLMILYALMAPMGSLLSQVFQENESLNQSFNYIMAVVIGTFLHISTTILFENSENHLYNRFKLAAIAVGSGLAMLTIL